jgi:hypothetical protein
MRKLAALATGLCVAAFAAGCAEEKPTPPPQPKATLGKPGNPDADTGPAPTTSKAPAPTPGKKQ